jgi:drug/metabolite transporter (DMT)-like permease
MKNQHLLYLHLSVFLFGFSALFARLIPQSPLVITFGRVFFSSLFIGLLLLLKKEHQKTESKTDFLLLMLSGLILAIHWSAFIFSIQVASVAIGTITFATFPVFLAVVEPFFFKEKFEYKNLIFAGITLLGIGIIVFNLEGDETNYLIGVLFGLIASITYGGLVLLNRRFSQSYPTKIILFYQQSWAAIILFPVLFFIRPILEFSQIGLLLIYGIIFTAVAQGLFIKGLQKTKGVTAGIISGLEPVYAILFSMLILSEMPSIHEIVGGLIVIAVAYLVTRS